MTKHPLTSKERRGLCAVAAAALLCILIPFIVRSCSPSYSDPHAHADTSAMSSDNSDSTDNSHNSDKTQKSNKKANTSSKAKATKIYPTRQPLDEQIP